MTMNLGQGQKRFDCKTLQTVYAFGSFLGKQVVFPAEYFAILCSVIGKLLLESDGVSLLPLLLKETSYF